MICEDWWFPPVSRRWPRAAPNCCCRINGSPSKAASSGRRIQLAAQRVAETGLPFVFCNQVGGQDELVFDGASFVLNADRSLAAAAAVLRRTLSPSPSGAAPAAAWSARRNRSPPSRTGWRASIARMMLGLRDYVGKNRFPGVMLGLSGGIDSALSAAVAVDALGPDRVRAVMLPSPYTSQRQPGRRGGLRRACSASPATRCRSPPAMEAFERRWRRCSPAGSPTSPRRTSSPARAA